MTDNTTNNFFSKLNPEDLKILNDKKTQVHYLKGETLFKQGAFAPYVIQIISGLVRVYLQTGHDKQVNIRLAKQGDFLAFSSVFGENVYNYSAVALNDTTICMIDKEALKTALLNNPKFALQATSKNFRNEKHLFEIIQNISYKQMRGKLASALLYLSDEEFLAEGVFSLLTRQDIADFATISSESAIKFLKEFEKEGLLKLAGKDIKITDYNKLEELSRKG
ncbi:MAG: Crp/Fnr family transcriptional regulator [Prolixibacteraceae bacterium]|nr:Crp/Fnr family transcriptional regulator [Prolixibacteraceae bacterium]